MSKTPKRAPVRIILLGSAGVGKTTVMQRVRDKPFEATRSTIAADFAIWDLPDGTKCTVFDMAGNSDREGHLTANYARHVDGILLMYDVTRHETFQDLRTRWLPYLLDNAPLDPETFSWLKGPVLVAGNKMDLVRRYEEGERPEAGKTINQPMPRAVSLDELAALAKEYHLEFFTETSAVTWSRERDRTPFDALFDAVLARRPPPDPDAVRLEAVAAAVKKDQGCACSVT